MKLQKYNKALGAAGIGFIFPLLRTFGVEMTPETQELALSAVPFIGAALVYFLPNR